MMTSRGQTLLEEAANELRRIQEQKNEQEKRRREAEEVAKKIELDTAAKLLEGAKKGWGMDK